MQKKFYIILLLCAGVFSTLSAQIRFQANAKNEIAADEMWRVEFKVNTSDASDFTPPSFDDFDVMSGPSSSTFSNYQMINGKTTSNSSLTITYLLSPKRQGTLTLGAASIRVGGKTYSSKPITVKVSGQASASARSSSSSSQREEPEELQRAGSRVTNKDLFFTVTADKANVYEQQAVVLTYKYHARTGVALTNISLRQKPDMQGFYVEDVPLPEDLRHDTETINGVLYKSGIYMQYLLFPQKSGKLMVPSIKLNCKIAQQQVVHDPFEAFFNGGGHVMVDVERATPALVLDVQPLPEPRPVGFSGAVGTFALKGEVLEKQVKSNDVGTFRLTVEGVGNMKLLQSPEVDFPEDFEVYPPKSEEATKQSADGMQGKLIYDYTFVPRNKGDYTLPPVDFIYFDIKDKAYKTLSTQPIALHVEQGKASPSEAADLLKRQSMDILPITEGSARMYDQDDLCRFASSTHLLAVLLQLLLFFLGIAAWKRYDRSSSDIVGRRRRKAGKKVTKHLKKVAELLDKQLGNMNFYDELSRAVKQYLAEKFVLSEELYSLSSLESALIGKGMSESLAAEFKSVLETCEFSRFSGSTGTENMDELLQRAGAAIEAAEKL